MQPGRFGGSCNALLGVPLSEVIFAFGITIEEVSFPLGTALEGGMHPIEAMEIARFQDLWRTLVEDTHCKDCKV